MPLVVTVCSLRGQEWVWRTKGSAARAAAATEAAAAEAAAEAAARAGAGAGAARGGAGRAALLAGDNDLAVVEAAEHLIDRAVGKAEDDGLDGPFAVGLLEYHADRRVVLGGGVWVALTVLREVLRPLLDGAAELRGGDEAGGRRRAGERDGRGGDELDAGALCRGDGDVGRHAGEEARALQAGHVHVDRHGIGDDAGAAGADGRDGGDGAAELARAVGADREGDRLAHRHAAHVGLIHVGRDLQRGEVGDLDEGAAATASAAAAAGAAGAAGGRVADGAADHAVDDGDRAVMRGGERPASEVVLRGLQAGLRRAELGLRRGDLRLRLGNGLVVLRVRLVLAGGVAAAGLIQRGLFGLVRAV